MDLGNMVDCKVKSKRKRSSDELYIESMRFDKNSKSRLSEILRTKCPNSSNMVLRVSCLFVDQDNFQKLKPYSKYSGTFYPDTNSHFKIRSFDLYYRQNNVKEYDDGLEISEVSMIIYAV